MNVNSLSEMTEMINMGVNERNKYLESGRGSPPTISLVQSPIGLCLQQM